MVEKWLLYSNFKLSTHDALGDAPRKGSLHHISKTLGVTMFSTTDLNGPGFDLVLASSEEVDELQGLIACLDDFGKLGVH